VDEDKSFWRNPLSFLFASRRSDEQVATYIVREHRQGRTLDDILDDPYVKNRCSQQDVARVLESPEVIQALGDDIVAEHLQGLDNTES
jgi:hypothetical protein